MAKKKEAETPPSFQNDAARDQAISDLQKEVAEIKKGLPKKK